MSAKGSARSGRSAAGRGGGTTSKQQRPHRRLKAVLKWTAILGVVGFLVLAGVFYFTYQKTTIPDPNRAFQAQASYVYYSGGKAKIGRFAEQNRESIPLADIPQSMQDAAVAAEDRTFYTNSGIDPKGIIRAAFSNAQGNATQGASTITQQYVKILYLSQERTLSRKIKEAFLSLKVQQQESKQEILEGYLNTIYFGRGAYGVQAASNAYFGHPAKKLTVKESAMLAAIVNSPGHLNPDAGKSNKQALLQRYRYVLRGMASMGNLDAAKADRLGQKLPKRVKPHATNSYGGQNGFMLTMVRDQLTELGFPEDQIQSAGLRVETTFTRKAMRASRKAVLSVRPSGLKKLHVATASVDVKTGALLGFYAGQDYLKSQLNWAALGGQPGSAFKPFALSAGIDAGFSLKDTFQGNSPYTYPDGSLVENEGSGSGTDYGAQVSLLTATQKSINTAYADLTQAIPDGPQKILQMAVDMGIPRKSPGLEPNAGIALGSATISPINMANGYATIANGGRHHDWFMIKKVTRNSDGKVLYRAPRKSNRVLDEDIASDVSYALQQVVQGGTGVNAQALGRPAAGKTGTATNEDGDVSSSWFVGYTPQVSTAVMYVRGKGNEALNGYLPSYYGADYPTRTWATVMSGVLEDMPVESFPSPAFVDGQAPQQGHTPYTPPPPKPSPTKSEKPKPTKSKKPKPTPKPKPSETSKTSQPAPSPPATSSGGGGGGGNGGGGRGKPSSSPSP